MRRALVATIVCVLGAAPVREAAAGRTFYGWLYGTEINPERGVEVESWILEENGKGDLRGETLLWWGPTIGLTPHLELAVPVEMAYEDDNMGNAGTGLQRFGAELRWRIQSPDPVAAGPLTTLVRLAGKRLITHRDGVRGEADLVIAYETGRFHAEIDLGGIAARYDGDTQAEFRPGAGATVEVTPELRLGAETYSELRVTGDAISWVAAGPTLSWTHGRFWLAATFAIGIYQIDSAPRVNFAIAF
jgi:hypothetical protein